MLFFSTRNCLWHDPIGSQFMVKSPIQGIEGDKKSPVDLSISLCQETQNKQLKKITIKVIRTLSELPFMSP